MTIACCISTDLTRLRLLCPGLDEVWHAPEVADEEHPPPLREIADAAAEWVSARLPGRRIEVVAFDVDESRCSWISTPTREPAVVAAAVRQRRAEWGENDATGELIQPLVGDTAGGTALAQLPLVRYLAPKSQAPAGEASAAVIESPDAEVKLFLDALDRRGLRTGDVASLWHLIARRSTGSEALTATVLADGGKRLIWSWASGGDLVACGVCGVPEDATAPDGTPLPGAACAAGRLAIDWLTWSSQLGVCPEKIELLAPEASPLQEAVGSAWPAAPSAFVRAQDPVGTVLRSDTEPAPGEADARRSAPELVHRPGKPHRRVYRLSALAVALAAVGVAGLALKNQRAATRYTELSQRVAADGRTLVQDLAPGYETQADLKGSLTSYFVELQSKTPRLPVSPAPKPIFDELDRILTALVPLEGVEVKRIDLSDRTCAAQFGIATYADGEALMAVLDQHKDRLEWTERVTGTPPNLTIRLTGLWK